MVKSEKLPHGLRMMAYRSLARRALTITQIMHARSVTKRDGIERKLRMKRKEISDIADVERQFIVSAQTNALRQGDAWKNVFLARVRNPEWLKTTGKTGARATKEIEKLECDQKVIDGNIEKLEERIAKIQDALDTAFEVPSGEYEVEAFFNLTKDVFEPTAGSVVVQIGPGEAAYDAEIDRARDEAVASSAPAARGDTPEEKFAAMIARMILTPAPAASMTGPAIDLNYPTESSSRGAAIIDY
jgi:hypothetical protein